MNVIIGTLFSKKNAVMKFPNIRFIPKKSNNLRISTMRGNIKIMQMAFVILYNFSFLGIFATTNNMIGILNIVDTDWNRPPLGISDVIFANEPINNANAYKFIIDWF